jgi:hypothetical protein
MGIPGHSSNPLWLVPLLVAGCTAAGVWGDDDIHPPVFDDDDTTDPPTDDDDTAHEPVLEHVPGAEGDPSAWLFDLHDVKQVDLVLSSEAIASLWASPYDYVEGRITIDGVSLDPVGIRIKGKLGSYRDLSGKSALKIDFNHAVPGQTFYGLEKLNLNNMVQDQAFARERTGYDLFNAMDVPAPRVGYGWVRLNGEDYGLYSLVEVYDDVFLERHFDEPSGNLYDGDYYLWPDWSYTLIDFTSSVCHLYTLDEGTDVALADVNAVVSAVASTGGTDQFTPVVGQLVDLEHFVRFWATDVWIGQYDGYVHYTNNYRVYFDPADGLARVMPWDPDWAFYPHTPVTSPLGTLAVGCKADPACHAHFIEALGSVQAAVEAAQLGPQLEQITDLILPYVDDDPRKEISLETALASQEDLRNWIHTRSAQLAATSGL